MTKLPAVALLAAALAACSSDGNKLDEHAAKLVDLKQTSRLETRWRYDIGQADNEVLLPVITRNAVYAANGRGKIFRLERASGKRVWRSDSGFEISAGVGAGEGLVLVGGKKGEVAAFAEDGTLRWTATVTSEVLGAPQVANGIVVVRTGDGRISALDTADGKRLWLHEHVTPALVVRSHAGVTIEDGTIYAGFPGGKLAAIDLGSGVLKWEALVSQPSGSTELERISDIISAPVKDFEQVCAVAFQGRVACFSLISGSLLWSRELSSERGMALLGNHLYVTDERGVVLALDKNSGSTVWKNDQLLLRRVSAPLVQDNTLVVGDFEGYLHVLDTVNGELVARVRVDDSPIVATPLQLGGGLLVQTQEGDLHSVIIRN